MSEEVYGETVEMKIAPKNRGTGYDDSSLPPPPKPNEYNMVIEESMQIDETVEAEGGKQSYEQYKADKFGQRINEFEDDDEAIDLDAFQGVKN